MSQQQIHQYTRLYTSEIDENKMVKENDYIKLFLSKHRMYTVDCIINELNKISYFCSAQKETYKDAQHSREICNTNNDIKETRKWLLKMKNIEEKIRRKEYIYFTLLDLITPKPKDMWGDRKRPENN